jgi:hypothetical protein
MDSCDLLNKIEFEKNFNQTLNEQYRLISGEYQKHMTYKVDGIEFVRNELSAAAVFFVTRIASLQAVTLTQQDQINVLNRKLSALENKK